MRDLLLFLSTPLLTYIFAAVFLLIWNRDTARRENLALGAGWALLGTGFLISLLSPDHWGRMIVVITHVPYTLAAVAISWGVLTRVGTKPPAPAQLWIAVTGFALLILTQMLGNSVVADLLITNLTCAAIMVMTALLFAQSGRRDLVERAIFVMLILTAAQFFIRPVLTLTIDGPIAAESYRDTVYYLALNWVFAFGSVLFGLSLIAGASKDQINTLKHAAAKDPLSGLLVRAEFESKVKAALTQASLSGQQPALIVADIDHFKQVNDIWGHSVGDRAIAGFGEMIAQTIRATDIAGRVGGEEFCILVANADETIAAGLAGRLRKRTCELDVSEGALDVRLTASFGVAERVGNEGYRSLFARADRALYDAKQAGRNRVAQPSQTNADEGSHALDQSSREKAA